MTKAIGGACLILSIIGFTYSYKFGSPWCDRINSLCVVLGVLGTVLVLL